MTLNKYIRSHWAVRKKEVTTWRLLLRSQHQAPELVEGKVKLVIKVFRSRRQDPDNAVGSMKPLIDAINREGWLVDDDLAHLELHVREFKSKRVDEHTEIEWGLLKETD